MPSITLTDGDNVKFAIPLDILEMFWEDSKSKTTYIKPFGGKEIAVRESVPEIAKMIGETRI